jgi:hypothetical protein
MFEDNSAPKLNAQWDWDGIGKELWSMIRPEDFATNSVYIVLEGEDSPNGRAFALSIRDGECPGSNILPVQNEKLLAKLRSINGQFVCDGLPVFYYEHL